MSLFLLCFLYYIHKFLLDWLLIDLFIVDYISLLPFFIRHHIRPYSFMITLHIFILLLMLFLFVFVFLIIIAMLDSVLLIEFVIKLLPYLLFPFLVIVNIEVNVRKLSRSRCFRLRVLFRLWLLKRHITQEHLS